MCVCGGGEGVGSSGFFKVNFNFPKFQGGPTYVIRGVGVGGAGRGVKLFSKGMESNC